MSEPFEASVISPALLKGPVADPAISMLLRKELLAQIKYQYLEMEALQLEQQIKVLRMQMEMLAKEYRIR
jgi:hypothetical protein